MYSPSLTSPFLVFVILSNAAACKHTEPQTSDVMNRQVVSGVGAANWESNSGSVDYFSGKWIKLEKNMDLALDSWVHPFDYARGAEKTNYSKDCHIWSNKNIKFESGWVFSIASEFSTFEIVPSSNNYQTYVASLFDAKGPNTGKDSGAVITCYFQFASPENLKELVLSNLQGHFVERTYPVKK